MLKKTVIFGSFISWAFVSSALAQIPSSQPSSTGFMATLGGYRHIFSQGSTFGMDISVNEPSSHNFRRRPNQRNSLFGRPSKQELNVIPSFSFGRVINDQFHIALGLGLGVVSSKQRMDNILVNVPASSSQTALSFIPSLGAEYAYTKHLSFIGNVSYEVDRKVNSHFVQNAASTLPGSNYWPIIKPKFLKPKAGIVYRF